MGCETVLRHSRPRTRLRRECWVASAVMAALLLLPLSASAAEGKSPDVDDAHDMMKWGTEWFALSELLEYAPNQAGRPIRYDLLGWVGGPVNRVWAKAEGTQRTLSADGDTELQVLYGRLISPFWDAQLGVRVDVGYGEGATRSRVAAALGVQGLAPGWFELEPTLFISQRGDISARLVASYDLLFTQRLVAQARLETGVAVQAVPEFGVGSGINDIDLGLRVRYEFLREVAPYVGVSWQRLLMQTADLARESGQSVGGVTFVAGLRLWY